MNFQRSKIRMETLERLFLFHAALTITIESAISRDSGYTLIMLSVASIIFVFSFFPKSYKYIGVLVCFGAAAIAAKGGATAMMIGPTIVDHLLKEPNPNFGYPLSIYFGFSAFIHFFGHFAIISDGRTAHLKTLKYEDQNNAEKE